MIISLIAAIGRNFELGKDGKMLWHLPADLKQFSKITSGHTVIMGRKTFESIGSLPLVNRRNIIVTRQYDFRIPDAEVANSITEALEISKNDGEIFILGGQTIYTQTLPVADKLYLTWVYMEFDADTFFPDFNRRNWKTLELTDVLTDQKSGIKFTFETLEKIR